MGISEQRVKKLVIAVIFSTILFLILHSTELTFQEYGNKVLLNACRIVLVGQVLFFLYKGHTWARWTLAVLGLVLVIGGILGLVLLGFEWLHGRYFVFAMIMMLCMAFNTIVLFFSNDVRSYMQMKRQ